MKTTVRIVALLVVLFFLALPSTAFAKGLQDDKVVFGGTYTLESGETLDGDLAILGGFVELKEDSSVKGDIVLMGGALQVSGEVQGDIVAFGGAVDITETAVVGSNVVALGGTVDKAIGAQVEGEIVENPGAIFANDIFQDVRLPVISMGFSPVFSFAWFVLKAILWAAVAILVVLFMPNPSRRVADTVTKQPLASGGLGLLTAVLFIPVMFLLVISICLIPAAVLLGIAVALAWAFGMICLGYEVGRRLAGMAKQEWAPALAAGLGTFILMLVVNGLDLIFCVGAIVNLLVGALGFGAVLLTRFGTQAYPLQAVAPIAVTPVEVAPPTPEAENPAIESGESEVKTE